MKNQKRERVIQVFANGSEYMAFLETQCSDCPHYVHWEEATVERPCCPVEEAIALNGLSDDYKPPLEWLDENGFMHRYDCRKKVGKGMKGE